MKLVGTLACLVFVGCASAPRAPAAELTAASVAQPAAPNAVTPAGDTATKEAVVSPAPSAEKPAAAESAEPLPKIAFTPEAELRKNTKAKLEAALKSIKRVTTPAAAAAGLTSALGKPTWIEDETKKVWVATDNFGCSRIVLDEDGAVNFESMRSTESKTLSSTARQNLCTGKIEAVEPL